MNYLIAILAALGFSLSAGAISVYLGFPWAGSSFLIGWISCMIYWAVRGEK